MKAAKRFASKLVFLATLLYLAALQVQAAVDFDFERRVEKTLAKLQLILNETRSIQRADQQEHTYEDKYALAEFATLNTWQSLANNVLPIIGLNVTEIWNDWDIHSKASVELHFRAKVECKFLSEQEVDVQGDGEVTTNSIGISYTTRKVHRVTEYKWQVTQEYDLFVCFGGGASSSSCQNNPENRRTLKSRKSSVTVTTTTKNEPAKSRTRTLAPLDITWLVKQFDPDRNGFRFKIDRNLDTCKTPRRNEQVEDVLRYHHDLSSWVHDVKIFLENLYLPPNHKGARLDSWSDPSYNVWHTVLPLFENQTVLTAGRVELLHQKEAEELASQLGGAKEVFAAASDRVTVSFEEASLIISIRHMRNVLWMHSQCTNFVEDMLRDQLVQAIGREIGAQDFAEYMKFHTQRFFDEAFAPRPFSVAVRHKDSAPVGSFSIEERTDKVTRTGSVFEPVQLLTRRLSGQPPVHIPIDAATQVQLTGDRILSGWIQYQFGFTHTHEPRFTQLTARARQFSSFVLLIGAVTGPNRFEPKSGIILKNKDEVLIPLLTESLPSAKEFKDAISSLSPEQQEFARAFRSMQLESSVFGIAVVQLKPQLEKLLNLPPGALAKEIQLTEDLTTLFVDHHIGADLLSFDGDESTNTTGKVALVKKYVGSVNEIIQSIKDEVEKEEKQKAKTRAYMMMNEDVDEEEEVMVKTASYGSSRSATSVSRPNASPSVVLSESSSGPNRGSGSGTAGPPTFATLKRGISDMATRASSSSGWQRTSDFDSYSGDLYGGNNKELKNAEQPIQSLAEMLQSLDDEEGGDGHEDDASEFGGDELGLDDEGDDDTSAGESPPNERSPASVADEENAEPGPSPTLDLTQIPKLLDSKLEQHDTEGYLRSMTIKTFDDWTLKRKANMLVDAVTYSLSESGIRSEKLKAFDLLDAISRSGSLPIDSSEFHVVIGVSHNFVNSLMKTLYRDNINPIRKAEKSLVLLGSEILGKEPHQLVRNTADVERLHTSFPNLVATL